MELTEQLRLKIYSRIDELPALPAVIPTLLSLLESEKSSGADIAEALSKDPSLASKVLRVANSAYYGFAREISSLDNAVPLLGFRMIQSLAVSIGIIHCFPSREGATPLFSQARLWIHSVAVGAAIRELRRKAGGRESPELLFSVGILHDIGKLVLDSFFREMYRETLEEFRRRGNIELHVAERERIGLDHGEVGGMLLRRWNLPEEVAGPIAAHHRTDIPEGVSRRAVAMLRLSDAAARDSGFDSEGYAPAPEVTASDLRSLGMAGRDIADLSDFVQSAGDRIQAFFSALF